MTTPQDIEQALRGVVDPELGRDVDEALVAQIDLLAVVLEDAVANDEPIAPKPLDAVAMRRLVVIVVNILVFRQIDEQMIRSPCVIVAWTVDSERPTRSTSTAISASVNSGRARKWTVSDRSPRWGSSTEWVIARAASAAR